MVAYSTSLSFWSGKREVVVEKKEVVVKSISWVFTERVSFVGSSGSLYSFSGKLFSQAEPGGEFSDTGSDRGQAVWIGKH